MASPSSFKCIWKKDSKLAKVKIEVDKAEVEPVEDELAIKTGGYENPIVVEESIGIINLKCSGKLCVKKDDPLCRGQFAINPQDESDKLTMYKLDVGERDELQPQIIMLESQLKERHFLHWTMPGPSVTFREFERYDSDGPQVDIDNDSDQKFMWVIPINQKGSDQFSLQPYDRDYYLICLTTPDIYTDKAIVVEGDVPDYYELKRDA